MIPPETRPASLETSAPGEDHERSVWASIGVSIGTFGFVGAGAYLAFAGRSVPIVLPLPEATGFGLLGVVGWASAWLWWTRARALQAALGPPVVFDDDPPPTRPVWDFTDLGEVEDEEVTGVGTQTDT